MGCTWSRFVEYRRNDAPPELAGAEMQFADAPQLLHPPQRIPASEAVGSSSAAAPPSTVRVVVTSDTHNAHREMTVPAGDVFIHCGDATHWLNSRAALEDFNTWLGTLPHAHKIVIGGNHDVHLPSLTRAERGQLLSNATYLENEAATVAGLSLYATPHIIWRPFWYRANAFSTANQDLFAQIPDGVDVLVTHSPPRGILDRNRSGRLAGSAALCRRVLDARPRLHVFGHCHDQPGSLLWSHGSGQTVFANVSYPNHGHVWVFDVEVAGAAQQP